MNLELSSKNMIQNGLIKPKAKIGLTLFLDLVPMLQKVDKRQVVKNYWKKLILTQFKHQAENIQQLYLINLERLEMTF